MPSPPTTVQCIELEISIAAGRPKVWRALTEDAGLWWPKEFYTGPAKTFRIEPRLGGRVYEDWGDGAGVIWYEIFGLNPGVSLDLRGYLGVTYGPAVSLLHVKLEDEGRHTKLRVSEAVIGTPGDSTEKVVGWEQIFSGGLKRHVEAST